MRGLLVALTLALASLPVVDAALPLFSPDDEESAFPAGFEPAGLTPGGEQDGANDPLGGAPGAEEVQGLADEGVRQGRTAVNETVEEINAPVYTCQVLVRVDSGYRGHVIESRSGEAARVETTPVTAVVMVVTSGLSGAWQGVVDAGGPPFPLEGVPELVEERLADLELSAAWQEDKVIWHPIHEETWLSETEGAPFVDAGEGTSEEVCAHAGADDFGPGRAQYYRPGGPLSQAPEDGWYTRFATTAVGPAPAGAEPAEAEDVEPWPADVAEELEQKQDDYMIYEFRHRDVDRRGGRFEEFVPFAYESPSAAVVDDIRMVDPAWIEPAVIAAPEPVPQPAAPTTQEEPKQPEGKGSPRMVPAVAPAHGAHATPLIGLVGVSAAVAVALARRRAA